ncbi:ABC transporter substrate-binding protein [Xylanimonas protaetiae]|uniref:ABC transporter substrate-binding protein n=1 Tax=Xylanimonas protaetiae TaxID=2509457 RepID=A0A4P6F721_9MICO|nr:ABC transporter substrate-binding protein [Xylanimonas protaetiae]QAY71275.1 ABC transporter substrate-binding protein [Xylanimonas protaetiae]
MSNPHRRRLTAGSRRVAAALVAVVALLTACSPAPGASSSAPTRTVTDARGREVDIPVAPARVVTLSEPTTDAAFAIGVVPVGATAARGQAARLAGYLPAEAADVTVVGSLGSPQLEQLVALGPDLILTDGTAVNDDVLLGKLQAIAPTLWVGEAGNTDWQAGLRAVGDALGKADAATAFVTSYDAEAARVRDGLGANAGARVSIVRWGLSTGAFLPQSTFPAKILADLGLTRPAGQDVAGNGHSEQVSAENVGVLDGDWMFFCTLGGAAGPETAADGGGATGVAASEAALATAAARAVGFTDLTAYRSGRVVPVDGSAWGSAGGPLAAWQILTDVDDNLVG